MSKKFVSFFSGAGGLDYGFIMNGWEPVFFSDFWKPAVDTLKENHPAVPVYDWDISTTDEVVILNALSGENVDVVSGGPPCQAFSRLNQNQLFDGGKETEININDPRRSLFMDFLRVVEYIKPKVVVMENVNDIATRKLGGDGFDKNRLIVDIIQEEFEKIDYLVAFSVLNATKFNVPQNRKRMIFIGVRKDLGVFPSIPFDFVYGPKVFVRDVLKEIRSEDPNQEFKEQSKEWIEKVKHIPSGGYYKHLPTKLKVLNKMNLEDVYSYSGQDKNFCFEDNNNLIDFKIVKQGKDYVVLMADEYYTFEDFKAVVLNKVIYRVMPRMGTYLRRVSWKISPTITRNPIIHPEENRYLTIREKAAIQTFPRSYKFCGNTIDQNILVGNAVPCNLALAIAKHIDKIMLDK